MVNIIKAMKTEQLQEERLLAKTGTYAHCVNEANTIIKTAKIEQRKVQDYYELRKNLIMCKAYGNSG